MINPEAARLSQDFNPYEAGVEIMHAPGVAEEEVEYGKEQLVDPSSEFPPNVMTSKMEVSPEGWPLAEWHVPMIDIDIPVRLIPSTQEDHWHLIFPTVKLYWWQYERLLKVLAECNIVENGYLKASLKHKKTILRLPWVKKNV